MDPKSLSADFRDFLESLNNHGVEYLLKRNKKASGRNKDLADLDNLP